MYKLFGLRVDETLEINRHQSYLLEQKAAFMTEFTAWFAQHDMAQSHYTPLLNDGVYEAFVNNDDQDGFYSVLYYQALAWHAKDFSLSRVLLILSECRQLFVLMSERKNNHRLAKALCRMIDVAQLIVSNVYQMHETLQHLKAKSQSEVQCMRRSFQLISAQVPEELVQAFIDHQNWKIRAFSCALGEIDDGDFPYSTHECLLGKWLNSGGFARIPEHELKGFEAAHEQVHRLGFLALNEVKMRHPERIVDF
ncbi:CZB domain-containing protein [Thiomicrorhabdus aquaedulcis]|uniref:CZB domain-containing protein n=1 Tax=Thiomicrorhabdus aquaedulcis TaxID=2211106 RepID=UPI000FDB9656|nr:CZB domain-containing protein [Thiomicrorhabdus aquaedulcis]